MADDRISNVIDEAKTQRQFDRLFNNLVQAVGYIKEVNNAAKGMNFGSGFRDMADALKNARAYTDSYKQARAEAVREESLLQQAILRTKNAYEEFRLAEAKEAAEKKKNKPIITGEIGSLVDLRNKLKDLTKLWDSYGPAARKANQQVLQDLKNVRAEVGKLEAETGRHQRNVGNYPTRVVGGLNGLMATLGITAGAAQLISNNSNVADQLSDLQRIMGLTADESDHLYDSLKKLDTRTSVSGLLNIANIAAKAGVAKEDIVGVTQAIDKLSVVLGKELGDADQITTSLVKIANIFSKDGKVTGDSLTAIGNGILTLANAGIASGPFIVDYTQRLAGLAKTANITLPAALGLASGFEELGQSSEVAGTATTQTLIKIAQNIPKFAAIAGQSVQDFSKLLREKPEEALIAVAQAMTKGKKGFDEIAEAFKDSEAKGVRVISTLATLGSNADLFRDKIKLAADAVGDASDINEQFEIKNTNLAASIEKLKNAIVKLTTDPNSNLGKFFMFIIDAGTGAIGVVDRLIGRITSFSNSDLTPEGLAKLATARKVRPGYDETTPDTERFTKALSESILRAKSANDQYIKDFGASTAQEQQIFLQAIEEDYKAAKNTIEQIRKERKQDTAEGIAANLNYIQLADKLARARQALAKAGNDSSDGKSGAIPLSESKQNKLNNLQLRAELDRAKIRSQAEIDSQKEIADNERNTLAERLAAAENYYNLKNKQAEGVADAEKKLLNEEIRQGKAVNEQKLLVDDKYNAEKIKNTKELGKMVGDILKDNADLEVKAITDGIGREQAALEAAANREMTALVKLYSERRITQKQYEDEKFRIENKYAILSIQTQLEATKKILEIQKLRGVDTAAEEQKLLELQNKLRDADLEYFQKTEEGKLAIAKEYADKHASLQKDLNERLKDLAKDVFAFATEIGNAQFENEKNRLQAESDEIDKKKEKDIAALDSQVLSEQQKADKVTLINAQAQAQKEVIERRQRDVDIRAAQFQKAISLMNIAISTAEAIFKINAQAAVLGATPIIGPALAAQALAQIPFVIASAAVQAAAVAIAPIPHYAHGTLDHPGGPLVAGDGGRSEVMVDPDGNIYKTPATDTVYDMPEHTRVFPSMEDFYKYASFSAFRPLPDDFDSLGGVTIAKRIIDGVGGKIDNLNATLKNKPVANIKTYTEKGIIKLTQENNSYTRWVNKYMT